MDEFLVFLTGIRGYRAYYIFIFCHIFFFDIPPLRYPSILGSRLVKSFMTDFRLKHSRMAEQKQSRFTKDESLFRIPPHYYLHVLDQNTNVSRLVVGPKTYIRQDNER